MPEEKSVERYYADFDYEAAAPNGQRIDMVPDPDGSWVDWDDYARLQARLEEVEGDRNRLHKALAEGHGVEDGGIWEDRAIAAEGEYEAFKGRLTSDPVIKAANKASMAEHHFHPYEHIARTLLAAAIDAASQDSERGDQ